MFTLATAAITPTTPLTGTWLLDSGSGNAADSLVNMASAVTALCALTAFVLGALLVVQLLRSSS